MLHPFAILVSIKGEHHEVSLPFVDARRFTGESLATISDDAALALMERVFEAEQEAIPRHLYCPDTTLRRVRVDVRFRGKDQRWEGRLSVVLRRWPGEDFYEATLPRLGTDRFALDAPSSLEAALARWLRERGGEDARTLIAALELAKCRSHEYLDLLEVDLDLPTILPRTIRRKRQRPKDDEASVVDRAKRRREVPPVTLREVGVNLVHRVLDGRTARTIGRDAMIESIARRIARPGAAVLLVGPSGAGKTAIVEAVIAHLTAEEARLHARMDAWRVDANRIISGMSYVGQWEARCEEMVAELSARGDLLVVDDLPSLVWAGRTTHEDTNVAGFLEPHLAERELRVIGECTAERLEAARDLAPSFFACFHLVDVAPLDEPTSLRATVARAREMERAGMRTGDALRIDPSVPPAALALGRRFLASEKLPGRAVRLLEQLATESSAGARDEDGRRVLDRAALVDMFAAQTGLPRFVLFEEDGRPHAEVLAHFERRIVGQPGASAAVAEIVTTLEQGLGDPTKPIASMLLVGPTGVGKTETAKALAEHLFGSVDRMVRFDMSELSDPWSAARLFGDALRPDGELTRRIRQQPFAVVLFDEIEKAHPAIFDALLALLGEGRLTSADGRTTDFCNTVVLMTSNLGVREADSSIGFADDELPDRSAHYVAAVRAFFRPELFNRIDRVIAYRPLGRDAVRPLAERAVLELMARRGLRRAGVVVDVEDELLELLAEQGFDPRYGARALRRVIEQELAVPLARRLVASPIDSTTLVSLYRAGDTIGIDAWPLVAPSRTPPPAARVETFDDLSRLHAEARSWLEDHAVALERARAIASELVLRYSRGALDENDWARFTSAGQLVEELDRLLGELARVEDEVLSRGVFESRVEVAHTTIDRWGTPIGRDLVIEDHFVARAAPRPPASAVRAVSELRLAAANVIYRAEAIDQAPEDALVRVAPGTRAAESRALARDLTIALATTWRDWADVGLLVEEAGRWRAVEDGAELERAGAYALHVRGLRARDLVQGELGFHLDVRIHGPDLSVGVVRVEDVGGEGDPVRRATELDRVRAAEHEARRRGEPPGESDALPVCRRFEEGRAIDPETGLVLERERERLAAGLTEQLSHAVAARFATRG